MAINWLEQLKQNAAQPVAAPASPGVGQVQRMLATKATGKAAGPGSGPAASAIGQQVAAQAGQAQRAQGAAAEQQALAGVQAGVQQVQERAGAQRADIAQQASAVQAQLAQGMAKLFDNLEASREQLGTAKYAAGLEQAGFAAAMQNQDYLRQMQDAGRRYRFEQGLRNNKELLREELGANHELLMNQLGFDRLLGADRRYQQEQLANINLDFAMEMASKAAKRANQIAMYQGAGAIVQGGIQAYGAYGGDGIDVDGTGGQGTGGGGSGFSPGAGTSQGPSGVID